MLLTGFRILTLAVNVPGPMAAARLAEMGAAIAKIEPPTGDGVARSAPDWYAAMHAGVDVRRLDLKTGEGQAQCAGLLAESDLLLTASRPSALARLGLDWATLHAHYPRLCQVAIVGHGAPDQEVPGHDLTYLASAGVLAPPGMPRTLAADLLGAERAASTAVALLLARERTGVAGYVEVPLADAAEVLALPFRHGLTRPGGTLGGGFGGYNLYATADGWIALAALEAHFWRRFRDETGLDNPDVAAVQALFLTRTAEEWQAWGAEHDLPIMSVREGYGVLHSC
jgi:alpha-methylacyl-CoA racemase